MSSLDTPGYARDVLDAAARAYVADGEGRPAPSSPPGRRRRRSGRRSSKQGGLGPVAAASVGGAGAACLSAAPHCPQKRASCDRAPPQLGPQWPRRAPQPSQKAESAGFSRWQLRHRIRVPLEDDRPRASAQIRCAHGAHIDAFFGRRASEDPSPAAGAARGEGQRAQRDGTSYARTVQCLLPPPRAPAACACATSS